MPTPLRLDIPRPCHEKWSEMSPQPAGGRHCTQCDRVLTDFTRFTDRELVTFFENIDQKVCGRFRADQLGRHLYAAAPKNSRGSWVAVLAGMSAFGLQAAAPPPLSVEVAQPQTDTLPPQPPEQIVGEIALEAYAADPDTVTVQGRILDPDGMPLIGVTVHHPGTAVGTVTDLDGRYQLRVPPVNSLVVSYLGFAPAIIDLETTWIVRQRPDTLAIETTVGQLAEVPGLLGEVIIVERPRTIFGKLRQTLRRWQAQRHESRRQREAVTECQRPPAPPVRVPVPPEAIASVAPETELMDIEVSPNPFGADLRLSYRAAGPAELMISLFDAAGRPLRFVPWRVAAGPNEHILSLGTDGLPGGTYFLRIEDGNGAFTSRTLVRE